MNQSQDPIIFRVACPFCQKTKKITLTIQKHGEIINDRPRSLLSVHIKKDIACEHEFIALIDANNMVRGYQKIDVGVSVEDMPTRKASEYITKLNSKIEEVNRKIVDEPQSLNLLEQKGFFYVKKINYINKNKETEEELKDNLEQAFNTFYTLIKMIESNERLAQSKEGKLSLYHSIIGKLFYWIKKRNNAAIHLIKALKYNPQQPQLCDFLSGVFLEINDLEKSEYWSKKAIELKPELISPWRNLLIIYDTLNKKKKVLGIIKEIRQKDILIGGGLEAKILSLLEKYN